MAKALRWVQVLATVAALVGLSGCAQKAEQAAVAPAEPEPRTTLAPEPVAPAEEHAGAPKSAEESPPAPPEEKPAKPDTPAPARKHEQKQPVEPKAGEGIVKPATPEKKAEPKATEPEPAAGEPTHADSADAPAGGQSSAKRPADDEGKEPNRTESASLTITGKVTVVSEVPEPGTVPYTECVTYIKYQVVSVDSGDYEGAELLAVYWGMKDNKLRPAAKFRPGQIHKLTLVPFSSRAELQRVMAADDTDEYALTPYWVVG